MKKKKSTSKGIVEIAGVKLYTAKAIADTFGVNVVTILRHIKKGNLKARNIGHKYYVTEKNLYEFLNAQSVIRSKHQHTKQKNDIDI